MTKHYVFSVIVSLIITAAVVLLMFLVMLPQVTSLYVESVPTYSKADSAEYQFVQTKELVTEILSKNYSIDGNDINNFTNNKQYLPGNYNPFTPKDAVKTTTENSTDKTATQNTTNSNTTSTKTGAVISGTTK